MASFRIEHGSGYRELYFGDNGELRQTSPARASSPSVSVVSSGSSVATQHYKMGSPTYRTGVYFERDTTRPPRPVTTPTRSVDPAHSPPQRTHITYRFQQESPGRESPPPPPYPTGHRSPSPSHTHIEIHRGMSPTRSTTYAAIYRSEMGGNPNEGTTIYQNVQAQRSSSPFQERKDPETLVPLYTAAYPPVERFPLGGAPSKIVYSTHIPPQGQVSSKPASERNHSPIPTTQRPNIPASVVYKTATTSYGQSPNYRQVSRPEMPGASPRPYQLRPTMDSFNGQNRSPSKVPADGKEAEVDALTNLLIQNMEVSGDPDFYGMCVKCGRAIMGDNSGCSALDQLFHIECFTCSTCGMCLKGHQFFAMEGKPYCEPCYMNTLEKCSVCSNPITDRILRATGKPYHPGCFTCVVCGKSLDGVQFTVDATNQIHCIEDFHKKFAPKCCVCDNPIMPEKGEEDTVRIVAMDRSFHIRCYRCEDCDLQLSSEADGRGCYPLDEHILCKQCNARRIQVMTTRMMTEL